MKKHFIFLCSFFLIVNLYSQKVTFYANISGDYSEESWIGHVWVSFENNGNTQVFGFHPTGLLEESKRKSDISCSFEIPSGAYDKGIEKIEEYKNSGYIPVSRDCRAFAYDVALAIGLKVPSRGLKSPADWLATLQDLNE